jgi:hypothetical protein
MRERFGRILWLGPRVLTLFLALPTLVAIGLAFYRAGWLGVIPVGLLLLLFVGLAALPKRVFRKIAKPPERLTRLALKNLLGEARSAVRRLSLSNMPEVQAWVSRTRDLIAAALGEGEAQLFMDSSGYEFMGGNDDSRFLEGRLRRLAELIGRVDGLSIRDDFDPEVWE